MSSASPSTTVPGGEGLTHTRRFQEDLLARLAARAAEIPDAVELYIEQAHLLAELGRPQEAAQVYSRATKLRAPRYPLTTRAYSILPYTGKTLPITVLLLVSPEWGNAPFRAYLDEQAFLTLQIVTDFHDAGLALPPHQLVINCISDADSCRTSLEAAAALLARTDAPRINAPADVLATTRESIAGRFAEIPGVRTPRVATFSRNFFAADNMGAVLEEKGFSFPLLVRAPGYHTGLHFARVGNPEELAAAVASCPGESISVIEFLDARGADGLIRKYRVMMIDGKFYPAHVAISEDWKVHFFSSTTPDSAEQREEDRNFLENMAQVLGERVMEALGRIRDALKLDYAGIDFSVGADGTILLFEANATMHVQPPAAGEALAYRRAPVQRIADAVRTLFFTRAFIRPGAAAASPTEVLREFTLRQIESALERQPERVDLQIERARLLIQLGRFDAAKDIYLAILTKDPTQVVALNNLGTLLNIMGFHEAALKVYREVVALMPDNAKAQVNLAHSLRETSELEEARAAYETALRLAPDLAEAHKGLAYVLMYLSEKEPAWEHYRKSLKAGPTAVVPFRGGKALPRLLVLFAPCGGNSPITRITDQKTFEMTNIVPDFHDPAEPLPPHDFVLNAVGDADYCGSSLEAAMPLVAQVMKPLINHPGRIRTTGRVDNARLLGTLEGVRTPRIVALSREMLEGSEAVSVLDRQGLSFPLLLRSPGFHGGSHFVRVESEDDLARQAATLPGRELLAIEYLDAHDDDGKTRKYRVMMIDGKLYPLHKAVSQAWMIHYYSADMAHSAEHRAEDEAFLEDMPGVLGARAMQALERVRVALGLDYAGADFSLGREGELLLFEANATMSVPEPDRGEKWDFRRPAVSRIHAAVREMLLARARAGRAG